MIAYVIASHGDLAESMRKSSFMIFGEQEQVAAVNFLPNESPEELKQAYEKAIASFSPASQVIFLVDLYGGTPFNVATEIVSGNTEKMSLISGLNLPMLVEAYTVRDRALAEVVAHLEATAKAGVRHLDIQDGEDEA
ncbi:PTS sugar transporter subunit IIA [Pediococcus siamensis]|uniref:PTS sugar transporter subunit IIA n=1 Tax=Pediococcus siamensis TaxID=381829 RepID=UPI00399FE380